MYSVQCTVYMHVMYVYVRKYVCIMAFQASMYVLARSLIWTFAKAFANLNNQTGLSSDSRKKIPI